MGYKWVTGRNTGPPEHFAAPADAWYTPAGGVTTALSVPSPTGPGDILERVEVAAWISVTSPDASTLGFFPQSARTLLIGDVGAIGAGAPDGTADGAYEFAFSWECFWTVNIVPFDWLADITPTYLQTSTPGYVTSKARRGPDTYGDVHPAFNLGVATPGSEYLDLTIEANGSTWSITARTLWRTP